MVSIRKIKRKLAKWNRYVARYNDPVVLPHGWDRLWLKYIRLMGPRAFVDAPRPE